ncbi:MAG: large subunit ribosomal protein [Chloroflexota bacterium]|jgi:large subunit ribosomal protein L6|nr:large subunit ribosomal protein [Chloroflexota bacterium]
MSRIGRAPIPLPSGVTYTLENGLITIKGPKGTLSQPLLDGITVHQEGQELLVERASDDRILRSLHGLLRTLVNNMVVGVTQGFEKRLQIVGTGYRAQQAGQGLSISVGFSHPVNFPAPPGITLTVEGPRVIVGGIDKQQVGEIAAQIRRIRPPEPYKGKGIRYDGEQVRRKAGKAGGKKR